MAHGPVRILLIEDNDDDADLVIRGVKRFNEPVELSRISSIPAAVDSLIAAKQQNSLPDLVLVDGRVDGMHATDFFELLHQHNLSDLTCVVLTGSVEARMESHLKELGARAVRWKPVDYTKFLDEIASILQQYRPDSTDAGQPSVSQ